MIRDIVRSQLCRCWRTAGSVKSSVLCLNSEKSAYLKCNRVSWAQRGRRAVSPSQRVQSWWRNRNICSSLRSRNIHMCVWLSISQSGLSRQLLWRSLPRVTFFSANNGLFHRPELKHLLHNYWLIVSQWLWLVIKLSSQISAASNLQLTSFNALKRYDRLLTGDKHDACFSVKIRSLGEWMSPETRKYVSIFSLLFPSSLSPWVFWMGFQSDVF